MNFGYPKTSYRYPKTNYGYPQINFGYLKFIYGYPKFIYDIQNSSDLQFCLQQHRQEPKIDKQSLAFKTQQVTKLQHRILTFIRTALQVASKSPEASGEGSILPMIFTAMEKATEDLREVTGRLHGASLRRVRTQRDHQLANSPKRIRTYDIIKRGPRYVRQVSYTKSRGESPGRFLLLNLPSIQERREMETGNRSQASQSVHKEAEVQNVNIRQHYTGRRPGRLVDIDRSKRRLFSHSHILYTALIVRV